jgi:putative two-component system response regulator
MMQSILVVDDDPITMAMVTVNLRKAGYRVVTALNGEEALTIIEQTRVGIVISDWDMPSIDGLELCRRVRARTGEGYTYIVLLTSHGKSEQRIQGLAAGADDFLTKPFDPRELLERVRVAERILQLETREALIFAMAKLAESRDPETGQHLERVQRYSLVLSRELAIQSPYSEQITPDFTRLIYQTSPLHDIGKVGIPDSVLQKPGKLTPEEFDIMKQHTEIGANAIRATLEHAPSAHFLQMALEIALSHHEKFDGTGYPHGLSGQAIPLSGRIIALVDVYDALTTKRVYKPAFTHLKAREIILEGRGKHFDPVIVDAFLRVEVEFDTIRLTMNGDADTSFSSPTVAAHTKAHEFAS